MKRIGIWATASVVALGMLLLGATCQANATTLEGSSKLVYGAIRDTGDGTGFQPIRTGGHVPVHIDSVATTRSSITVHYESLNATVVGTFLVEPDETFAKLGLICGASVGFTEAVIQCSENGKPVDMTTLTTEAHPYSNLWIYGVFQ